MYHSVTAVGFLGGDPEMRYSPQGDAVTNFSLACNRKWKTQDGEQHEETIWFRVTCWRGLAETVNEYLSKGRQVMVIGRLNPDRETGNPRVFERNDGSYGASFELTAQQVLFLGGKNGAQQREKSGSDYY